MGRMKLGMNWSWVPPHVESAWVRVYLAMFSFLIAGVLFIPLSRVSANPAGLVVFAVSIAASGWLLGPWGGLVAALVATFLAPIEMNVIGQAPLDVLANWPRLVFAIGLGMLCGFLSRLFARVNRQAEELT